MKLSYESNMVPTLNQYHAMKTRLACT